MDDTKRTASLAWDNPLAVRELTKTLLLHDFQLDWTMPLDRLCPPLPNRLNYIHWIEDLLLQVGIDPFACSLTTTTTNPLPPKRPIYGLDIGTGASCIFPLLGARLNNWRFVATEIDAQSLAAAHANVDRNQLGTHIDVQRVTTQRLLLEPLASTSKAFDFSMCNPPFFDAASEFDTNPQRCCRGSASEMVTPGGEVAFITAMIDDSVELQTRVTWYTSLIGRKRSIRKLLAVLRDQNVQQMRTTEFCQGRTKRWGIAWSFVPASEVADETFGSNYKVLGKRKEAHRRNELVFLVPCSGVRSERERHSCGCASVQDVVARVRAFAVADRTVTVEAESDSSNSAGEQDEGGSDREEESEEREDDESDYAFMRLRSVGENDAFQGRVEVTVVSEAPAAPRQPSDFRVSVEYEAGARSAFWRIADALKAATVRSGRQWRRRQRIGDHTNAASSDVDVIRPHVSSTS